MQWYQVTLSDQFAGWLHAEPQHALALHYAMQACPGTVIRLKTDQGLPLNAPNPASYWPSQWGAPPQWGQAPPWGGAPQPQWGQWPPQLPQLQPGAQQPGAQPWPWPGFGT